MRISTMGTASTFFPLGEDMYAQLLEGSEQQQKIYLHRVLHHDEGFM